MNWFIKIAKDQIKGGLADNSDISEFDPKQILMGISVEKEHTGSEKIAREIAKDHLKEDPYYYTKLKYLEKGYNILFAENREEAHDILYNDSLRGSGIAIDLKTDERLFGCRCKTNNIILIKNAGVLSNLKRDSSQSYYGIAHEGLSKSSEKEVIWGFDKKLNFEEVTVGSVYESHLETHADLEIWPIVQGRGELKDGKWKLSLAMNENEMRLMHKEDRDGTERYIHSYLMKHYNNPTIIKF